MRLTAIAPVLNEFPWIGYSIMSASTVVDDFIYSLDKHSNDGTRELLNHVKKEYLHDRLTIIDTDNFHPHDMKAYNASFNVCIGKARGDAVIFLHPDMIVTRGAKLSGDATAWWTNVTSYAGDLSTQITKGRATRWKNIHAKKFGLHYFGGYGSVNEDFYHSDITGTSYKHYGEEFSKYPFSVENSLIEINHYCEVKSYKRRFEKMKLCLKTQHPSFDDLYIEELAMNHPRVTLSNTSDEFGRFEFTKSKNPIPDVITKYKDEFESLKKELVYG